MMQFQYERKRNFNPENQPELRVDSRANAMLIKVKEMLNKSVHPEPVEGPVQQPTDC
jgi:hypothetical protein